MSDMYFPSQLGNVIGGSSLPHCLSSTTRSCRNHRRVPLGTVAVVGTLGVMALKTTCPRYRDWQTSWCPSRCLPWGRLARRCNIQSIQGENMLTEREQKYCAEISGRVEQLRDFLNKKRLGVCDDLPRWLSYLSSIRIIQGNLSNDVSFVATRL